MLAVALVATLAVLIWRATRRSTHQYREFKKLTDTVDRQRMYRSWLRDNALVFGALAIVLTSLSARYIPALLTAIQSIRWYSDFARQVNLGWVAIGVAAALIVLPLAALWLAGRHDEVPALGDIQAMIPRNIAEVRWGAALAVNAGVLEELVFRLALPAVIFGATGNLIAALVGSVLVFGGLHAYQGVAGVVTTTVIGVVLLCLYLATGSIVVPIVVHVVIDLRSFVFIPIIVFGVRRTEDSS